MSDDLLFAVEEERDEKVQLRLLVHFLTKADRHSFSLLIGQHVVESTDSITYPIAGKPLPAEYLKAAAELASNEEQSDLLDISDNWRDAWKGMPPYANRWMAPQQTVSVYFENQADRRAFAHLLGQKITDETKSLWHPKAEVDEVAGLRWRSTRPQNPRYPVYVPTKGRWDSAFTIKCLEKLGVPYFAVVQPQEREHYEPVVKTGVMLLLPEGLDGLVPTRNWIFEHAVASGAERHWQLDDNIKSFFRYHENRQIHVADGTCLRVAEDFADRYENVAIAGFQYFMFVPRKKEWPPYVFNTRVYSNSLINNAIPFRYRDVYNDDTDICLRALKAGWCTVQFNAFLAWKQPTMVVKGGNTPIYLGAEAVAAEWEAHAESCKQCHVDENPTCVVGRAILQKDGRWRMADSLQRQHPDVTIVGRRWNRWQHYVDYRRFKQNQPIFRQGVVLPEGQDDYGLELVTVERRTSDREERPPREEKAPRAQGPSVFAFLQSLAQQEEPTQQVAVAPCGEGPAKGEVQPVLEEPATDEPPQPVPVVDVLPTAAEDYRDYLLSRGHRLLTRDGKFFVSEATTLTEDERRCIKLHRDALIALAEEWKEASVVAAGNAEQDDAASLVPSAEDIHDDPQVPEDASDAQDRRSIFDPPRAHQTLAEFLDGSPSRVDVDFTPDVPPDLTGIDEVILNFATDGLDWSKGARPVGVTVSTLDGGLTRFLPFAFRGGGNLDEEVVKRWAREQLRGKKVYNAKTKFDLHMAREWGVDLEEQGCTFSDIQHTAALLDDHRGKFRSDGLKPFAIDTLALDYLPGNQEVARVDESRHADHHASEVAERELYTARLVGRLRDVMYPELDKQELREVQKLEDDVIPAVVEMEKNGALIDVELCERYYRECVARHGELMMEVAQEVGFAFEHTASGWQRLFEYLHLPPTEGYAEDVVGAIEHPTVKKAHYAAQIASLNSKTFGAYRGQLTSDGILRCDINQLIGDDGGTVSGRFSVGYVQQVPNWDNHSAVFGDLWFPRRAYISASGDYLEADARQIEYRLFAHFASNPAVLKAYADDPLMSFHEKTWEMFKQFKPDMLYAHQKNLNFAKQYGARTVKLGIMMGFITKAEGDEIRQAKRWNDPRLSKAKEIEAIYARVLPEGNLLLDRASHLAKFECDNFCKRGDALHRQYPHRGFVKTIVGRRSRFPTNYKTYIGLNRVLQGSGADYLKKKSVELHRERKYTGFLMRLTVHDAFGGDAQMRETLARVGEILDRQSFPQLKVPIKWKVGVGKNWAECK